MKNWVWGIMVKASKLSGKRVEVVEDEGIFLVER